MNALKKGDTIAVFSPSSPATKTAVTRYRRGKEYLISKGFTFLEGKLTGKADFYRSGSIRDRAEELNELIRNPEVRCIMSSIGGMNSNSILPYIDYEAFKANPKILVGYSDITAVLLAVYQKTGIPVFYGPAVVASFGEFPPLADQTFSYFFKAVSQMAPFLIENPEMWTEEMIDWNTQDRAKTLRKNKLVTVNGGRVQGRLIGGNLNTMQGIWNTEYMPEIKKGDILFIEDSLKDIAVIERSFALLKLSGIFEKVGGLVLGKHEHFDDLGTGRKPYEVLMEVMQQTDIPILAEYDSCHTHPMITLPIGAVAELDADRQSLSLISY